MNGKQQECELIFLDFFFFFFCRGLENYLNIKQVTEYISDEPWGWYKHPSKLWVNFHRELLKEWRWYIDTGTFQPTTHRGIENCVTKKIDNLLIVWIKGPKLKNVQVYYSVCVCSTVPDRYSCLLSFKKCRLVLSINGLAIFIELFALIKQCRLNLFIIYLTHLQQWRESENDVASFSLLLEYQVLHRKGGQEWWVQKEFHIN